MNKFILISILACLFIPVHEVQAAMKLNAFNLDNVCILLTIVAIVGGAFVIQAKRIKADLYRGDNLWERTLRSNGEKF
jgi:hypothetical protein